jgi:acyl dehydratase
MTTAAADAISPGVVGAQAGPIAHAIDARWLMAYAAALGERDGRYFDTLAPGGPLAHPLFAVCYEWPAAVALRERTVAASLLTRSVHATHRLVVHRPPRAGDVLRTTGRVVGVEPRRAGTLLVSRFETVDVAGRPVTTTDYGSVYRGVALAGAAAAGPAAGARPRAVAGAVPAAGWTERVAVDASAAWVYTECARIWNPIHTDVAVARDAGLAGPILHGTATLALAVSRVVTRELGGDPAAVAEVSAKFTGMVPMPSTLTVRGARRPDGGVDFEVVDEAGAPVVVAGTVRVRATSPPGAARACDR